MNYSTMEPGVGLTDAEEVYGNTDGRLEMKRSPAKQLKSSPAICMQRSRHAEASLDPVARLLSAK
jgi:hypothetical protein